MRKPRLTCLTMILAACGGGNHLSGEADADSDSAPLDTVVDSVEDPPTDEPDTTGWECVTDEDCDDSEPCTADTCDPDGHTCTHADVEGLAVLGPEVQVTSNPEYSGFHDLVWTGSDVGVFWHDGRDTPCPGGPGPTLCNFEVYFKRITLDGEEVSADERVSYTDLPCYEAEGVWTGSEFGVAWECGNYFTVDIYFRRIGADGTALDSQLELASFEMGNGLPSLVWTGSEYIVGWEQDGTRLARVAADGSLIDDTVSFPLTLCPEMTWTGSDLAMAWIGTSSTGERGLIVSRVSPEGVLTEEVAYVGSINALWPEIAWTGSDIWVSYLDIGSPPDSMKAMLYLARIDGSGGVIGDTEPVTTEEGSYFIWSLFWTGSELDMGWVSYGGWEPEQYLSRFGPDGARLEPDLALHWPGSVQAWNGTYYILGGADEREGVVQVYLDRLGSCD